MNMKKTKYYIIAIVILFSITGCEKQQSGQSDRTKMTPDEIAASIVESQSEIPFMRQLHFGDEEYQRWLSDYYLIPTDKVENGAVFCADGAEASEIGLLELTDEGDSESVKQTLEEYRQSRAGVFEGYAPQQAALAKGGQVVSNGKYIALLICQDIAAAEKAFLECFEENAGDGPSRTEDKPVSVSDALVSEEEKALSETDNAYDSSALLAAWRSGDASGLSESDLQILSVAKNTIQEQLRDDMSDYEKELTIHDWITEWSSFDYGVFNRSDDGYAEGSDTPYGVLVDREAMCHGYSSTFQLFMDMLDIECITVFGTPDGSGVQHSWNMVKLEGEWYCVDTAWDDPIGGRPGHSYFNVTSDELKKGSIHHWDETSVPEASGTKYAYTQ